MPRESSSRLLSIFSCSLSIALLSTFLFRQLKYVFSQESLFGRNSDRSGERRWHFNIAACLGAVGIVISKLFRQNTLIAMVGLTMATIGILATLPVIWSVPTAVLAGNAAAGGIGWINSVGNLAGFFGPSIVGVITDLTKRSDYGLYAASAMLLVGAALVLAFVPKRYQVDLG
jgi:nitrate/nitrite transporter NarK